MGKNLGLEATNHIPVGFGSMQVNGKRGGTHWLKCNLANYLQSKTLSLDSILVSQTANQTVKYKRQTGEERVSTGFTGSPEICLEAIHSQWVKRLVSCIACMSDV